MTIRERERDRHGGLGKGLGQTENFLLFRQQIEMQIGGVQNERSDKEGQKSDVVVSRLMDSHSLSHSRTVCLLDEENPCAVPIVFVT